MANTSLNQFIQEQKVVNAVSTSGLTEELLQQDQSGEWSEALSADELLEALQIDSAV